MSDDDYKGLANILRVAPDEEKNTSAYKRGIRI